MRSLLNGTDPRALITGAPGFVGGLLARRLLVEGWELDLVVRLASSDLLISMQ
ncbi:MAG: hypothetical protein WCF24_00180 [Acidimicrobiales bacterium]